MSSPLSSPRPTAGTRPDVEQLLGAPAWRALDVDGAGRVLATTDGAGSMQLVELRPDGSAAALTALPGACTGRYLPGHGSAGDRAVIVQHDEGGDERGQLSLLWIGQQDGAPAGLDDLVPLAHDPRYLHRIVDVLPGRVVYTTNRRDGVDLDVVMRAVEGGAEEIVYAGGGMVQGVAVSPDARHVALTVPGTAPLSDQVLLVDTMPLTEDVRVTALTAADEHARNVVPRWLADEQTLVLTSNSDRDRTAVSTVDISSGERRLLAQSDEHDLTGWPSPDGRLLLVEANVDGESRLAVHDTATGDRLHAVSLPTAGSVTYPVPDPVWSPDSRRVALSFTAPGTPGDVLLLDVATGAARALTDSGAALGGSVAPTVHRVPVPDGDPVPCLVYSEVAESDVDGVPRSAVLVVHGGPESQSRLHFNPVIQALAAAGHVVVVPNVRGSTGHGKRWYSADDRRARLAAVADLAAVHEWLPSIGCDPARAALWGGSYGGYLVLAGLAFQPERWAVGVDIVGISSLVTFLENTSPYRRAHREREYGSLATDRDFLLAASPLSRVDEIRAPLFVVHGANDPRVPLSEAEQIVAAVRERDIECELIVYRDEGHGLAKRANRLDAYSRALAFLARHLTP